MMAMETREGRVVLAMRTTLKGLQPSAFREEREQREGGYCWLGQNCRNVFAGAFGGAGHEEGVVVGIDLAVVIEIAARPIGGVGSGHEGEVRTVYEAIEIEIAVPGVFDGEGCASERIAEGGAGGVGGVGGIDAGAIPGAVGEAGDQVRD